MKKPFKDPPFRRYIYNYTIRYVVIKESCWFNRRVKKTVTFNAHSELGARQCLELRWNEGANCLHITSIIRTKD